MKTRLSRRQTAKVSHSRWLGYATAGAATALAGSNCLEAGIHYSGRLDVVAPQSNKRKEFRLDQPGDHFELTHLNFGFVEFEIIGFSHGFRGFV